MRVLGILLMILGFLGAFAEGCAMGAGRAVEPFSGIVVAVSFFVAGYAALIYSRRRYKGGVTSIIGVVLLWIGVVGFAAKLENYLMGRTDALLGDVSGLLVFCALGVALLIAGHRIHKERSYSLQRPGDVSDREVHERSGG